jgi:ABC-type branched-subunit amino acid transport system permease subunit
VSAYLISVVTVGAITAILCLGVNVSWGWAGQLDLAFYVYVALGAYFAAVLELPKSKPQAELNYSYILGLRWPFVLAVIGASAAGAAASCVVGYLALRRIRSDYIAIITVVTALIATAVLGQDAGIFGGQIGVYGLNQPFNSVLKLQPNGYSYFYMGFMLACLAGTYGVVELLYRSRFGRSLRAVREQETAAAAFGRNLFSLRLRAYILGGTIGAFGGALYVNYLSAWNPSSWSIFEVVLILSGVVVGGRGNSLGVIVGSALVLSALPEITRLVPVFGHGSSSGPAIEALLSSLLIILILRFRPLGLLPERKTTIGAAVGASGTTIATSDPAASSTTIATSDNAAASAATAVGTPRTAGEPENPSRPCDDAEAPTRQAGLP